MRIKRLAALSRCKNVILLSIQYFYSRYVCWFLTFWVFHVELITWDIVHISLLSHALISEVREATDEIYRCRKRDDLRYVWSRDNNKSRDSCSVLFYVRKWTSFNTNIESFTCNFSEYIPIIPENLINGLKKNNTFKLAYRFQQ